MDSERREYPRFKKTLPVIIHRPRDERGPETSDISLGGASIYNVQKYYDVEEFLSIELVLEECSIFSDAKVVSIYPHDKDASGYRISLQFIDMSDIDKEKLKSFLETC